jgi:uncharacterized alpha-E superfamily protein
LKTYTSGSHSMNILDHVIANKNFPRSIFYSLARIQRYLDDVTNDTQIEGCHSLQKLFGRLHSKVKFADLGSLDNDNLPEFLDSTRRELVDFSKQLSRIYFSYA